MKRLFIAIPVSEEVRAMVALLNQQLKETGNNFNFVSLENLHFTVKFLGDVDDSKVDELKFQMKQLAIGLKPFSVEFKGVGVFPDSNNIKVIWVGMEGKYLVPLMKSAEEIFSNIRREEREEKPHLTIGRVKLVKNIERLHSLLKKVESLSFGSMDVRELILFESNLTPVGPIYTALEKVRLG